MKKEKGTTSNNNEEDILQAVENLAIMTKRGFDSITSQMVSKEEFNEFKSDMLDFKKETDGNFFKLDSKLNDVDKRLKKVEEMIEPLFLGYTIMQKEFQSFNTRLSHLEKKLQGTK